MRRGASFKRLAYWSVLIVVSPGLSVALLLGRQAQQTEVWRGHEGPITDFAFSPGGNAAVSSSLDGTVRVWDAGTGKQIRILAGHESEVFAVSISADGRVIGSADYAGVILVHTEDGKREGKLSGFPGWTADVAVSPDGKRAAGWAMDGNIWIWDLGDVRLFRKLEGEKNRWGMALAWSRDGRYLAAGRIAVTVWNPENGERVKTLEGHKDFVRDLAFSPDGRLLASSSMDKTVRIWSLESGESLHVFRPEGLVVFTKDGPVTSPVSLPLTSVCFSPDGTFLAAGGADRVVRLWDVKTGEIIRRFEGHRMTVTAVSFSPDGKRLGSAGLDRTIRVWDVEE